MIHETILIIQVLFIINKINQGLSNVNTEVRLETLSRVIFSSENNLLPPISLNHHGINQLSSYIKTTE